MNGRALNEKAIEVSPSSARVLDRAADILTPFPPSKNRPRPGDWTCPSCGFSNFQRRTACFRCSYPAMGHGPNDAMGFPGFPPYGPQGIMGGHGHMGGHHGSGMGRGSGAMIPFRAGDWKCGSDGCGYHNFAKNVSCLRCGASRANAAVVADNAFPSTMEPPSGYGMHAAPPPMSAPGAGFGPPGSFGSTGGYHGQQYGGPPSTYALPTGLGAAASPYPAMGTPYNATAAPQAAGAFDSRAESAFSSASQPPSSIGASISNGQNPYAYEGGSDPFSFLSSGMSGLSVNDDGRRTGGSNVPKNTS